MLEEVYKMLEQMNFEGIAYGFVFLMSTYMGSIILNIVLVKGKSGILPGTFKLYSFAVIVSALCNSIDVVFIKNNIQINWIVIKYFLIGCAFIVIEILKSRGDPRYVADFKDISAGELDPGIPFTSTEGMSLCIMVAYTFPIVAAIIVICVIMIIQGLYNLEKYEFKRTIALCLISVIETIIASWLVRLSYNFDILRALIYVALIGVFFNVALGSANGLLLDYVTKDYFLKD